MLGVPGQACSWSCLFIWKDLRLTGVTSPWEVTMLVSTYRQGN